MNQQEIRKILENAKLGGIIFGIFILGIIVLGSFYTVEPDEQAVIIRLGKYLETTDPGLHFKIPIIDKKIIVQTRRMLQQEFGFRTTDTRGSRTTYSSRNYDDESLMLSGDLNVAIVQWVVQYRISNPYKYLFKTKERVKNIRDVSESIMRRVVGDLSVTDVLTIGRVGIESRAKVLMQDVLNKYDMGIRIEKIALQDVNPPDSVKASFNEVNEAKQEQEKLINQAERTYNTVIPKAKGAADKLISEAEGYANALINRSKGDAEKFASILIEYQKAPSITRKRIYIETMEEIFQNFSNMTIVDSKVKGLLPVFKGLEKQ